MIHSRKCPSCDKILTYTRKYSLEMAIRKNRLCISCGQKKTSHARGKPRSDEVKLKISNSKMGHSVLDTTKEKLRKYRSGKRHNPETIDLLSKLNSGKNNAFYGKTHSPETKIKIRTKLIERLKKHQQGTQANYNPKACSLFEEINRENNWRGRHAENGGEYYIEGLGYWVDYYEPTLNIVIEFDEKHHQRKKYKIRDLARQQEIEQHLNCKFYRIPEALSSEWRSIINGEKNNS